MVGGICYKGAPNCEGGGITFFLSHPQTLVRNNRVVFLIEGSAHICVVFVFLGQPPVWGVKDGLEFLDKSSLNSIPDT